MFRVLSAMSDECGFAGGMASCGCRCGLACFEQVGCMRWLVVEVAVEVRCVGYMGCMGWLVVDVRWQGLVVAVGVHFPKHLE